MTMNRVLILLATAAALPSGAAAQRFAGVIDATGPVTRPLPASTVTPAPGIPMLLPTSAVLVPPTVPGFFTPRATAPVVPATSAAVSYVVQPVFVPVSTASPEVTEDAPLDAEALAAVPRDARVLEPRRSTSTATFQARRATGDASEAAEATTGSAIGRCQAAALRQLRASNVQAADLRFEGNSAAWTTIGGTAEVRGGGILRDTDRGQWRRFSYVCDHRAPSGQTRAVVRLERAP